MFSWLCILLFLLLRDYISSDGINKVSQLISFIHCHKIMQGTLHPIDDMLPTFKDAFHTFRRFPIQNTWLYSLFSQCFDADDFRTLFF